MGIKEIIKNGNTPLARSLKFLVMLNKSTEFSKWVDLYYESNSLLNFKELGSLNKDKNIYIMNLDDPTYGFFACWKEGLIGLAFADRYNLTPVIDWGDKNPYYEKNGIDEIFNPFEYFYEPVSDVTLKEAQESYNVSFYGPKSRGCSFLEMHYGNDGDYEFYAEIAKKYYKVRKELKEKIDAEIKSVIGDKKTLAVQIRGVEWGNVQGHPIPPSLEKYVEEIDEAIKKCGFEQIFLATDSDETVEYISKKYNENVVVYPDVARTPKGSKVLPIFDENLKRENNNFLLGYEVLRDMLTLTACQGFIASYSNISLAVQITKLSFDEKFEFLKIINTKLCQNGVSATELAKKSQK